MVYDSCRAVVRSKLVPVANFGWSKGQSNSLCSYLQGNQSEIIAFAAREHIEWAKGQQDNPWPHLNFSWSILFSIQKFFPNYYQPIRESYKLM